VNALVAAASFGLAVAVGTWLSWRSPMVLSEEDTPHRREVGAAPTGTDEFPVCRASWWS
jgi:hypothetical protein